jgi:RNA polymerase sigma factor (sigma-70 family)
MIGKLREQDFERLFEEHAQPLFGFLVYRTGNRNLAEERALGRIDGASPAADRILETLADRELMQGALATLSGEEREAIALRYGADLTLPEIAKLTGEPLTTVKGRVYRALRKLREELTSPPEAAQAATSAPGR